MADRSALAATRAPRVPHGVVSCQVEAVGYARIDLEGALKIFLSWSGDRSRAVALALHETIPAIISGVEPWMSKTDIPPGARWASAIGGNLEQCDFGIICLTPENVERPWILFEAGALSKRMTDSAVVPYLYGMDEKDVGGPLGQFQAKKAEKDPTLEIVLSINARAGNREAEAIVRRRFNHEWSGLEAQLAAIPKPTSEPTRQPRPDREVLEDVVSHLHQLSREVADIKAHVQTPQYPGAFVFSGSSGPSVPERPRAPKAIKSVAEAAAEQRSSSAFQDLVEKAKG